VSGFEPDRRIEVPWMWSWAGAGAGGVGGAVQMGQTQGESQGEIRAA